MKYMIKDGGFVYCKDYDTVQEAMLDAEKEIRGLQFGELDDWTICEQESGKVVRIFKPSIEWA